MFLHTLIQHPLLFGQVILIVIISICLHELAHGINESIRVQLKDLLTLKSGGIPVSQTVGISKKLFTISREVVRESNQLISVVRVFQSKTLGGGAKYR